MTALVLALLPILFLLDVVARMRELTRRFVGELHAIAQDPLKLADLRNIPEARAWFEGRIAFSEEAVHLLIHERARQILGLPYIYIRRNRDCPPLCARPLPDVLKRLQRPVALHANIDRLAHRRAERMRRATAENLLAPSPSKKQFRPRLAGQPARSRALVPTGGIYAATRSPQSSRSSMSILLAARSGSAIASAGR